jgi:soluble lytic murein transglycosylase
MLVGAPLQAGGFGLQAGRIMNRNWMTAISRSILVGAIAVTAFVSFSGGDAQQATLTQGAAPHPAVPDADFAHLRDGLFAVQSRDWAGLRTARAQAVDPLVHKILTWRLASVQNSDAQFDDIDGAMKELANWPGRDTMRRRGEQMIFDASLGPADRVAWLTAEGGPLTGDGQIALAQAYARLGKTSEAQNTAREAFRERNLTPRADDVALGEFGGNFTHEDYADRVDRLLWRDDWGAAEHLLGHLSGGDRAVANARIALQHERRKKKFLQRALAGVPAARRDDAGFLYDRARYLRRSGRPEDALEVIARIAPLDAPASARESLFEERRLYVPRALRMGQARTAYGLVTKHGLTGGEDFAEAEWLSGWIALRFLKQPADADAHFTQMGANVSTPVSKARALYWRAEAARTLGRAPDADALLAQAGAYDFTYYGQLAAVKRDPKAVLNFVKSPPPAPEARAAFEARDLVRALRLISTIGDREAFEAIAFYFDDHLDSAAEHEMLARIALDVSYTRTAVRSAKSGIRRGIFAQEAAFPVVPLPASATAPGRPEPALILAITRQESEFDPGAVSGANARGLMQLLPSVAKAIAREQGMSYDVSSLTNDPSYNLSIGSAYLGDLIDRWGGSYILAVASYNAGPARAQEWIEAWGDPREAGIDAVDWVELIPIPETRNYVQRVLENLEVYRQRLAGGPVPIRITEDLKRGGR